MATIKKVLAMAFVAAAGVLAQDGRPCGLKIAPCPEDQHCVPDDPDCTNPDRCPGHCQFSNTYTRCGGFRVEPQGCEDPSEECRDDPRDPDSCGLACDIPGICINVNQHLCDVTAEGDNEKNGVCPMGLYCYSTSEDDNMGICL